MIVNDLSVAMARVDVYLCIVPMTNIVEDNKTHTFITFIIPHEHFHRTIMTSIREILLFVLLTF